MKQIVWDNGETRLVFDPNLGGRPGFIIEALITPNKDSMGVAVSYWEFVTKEYPSGNIKNACDLAAHVFADLLKTEARP